jgi:protein involved in polysaccharide export with SLBB domain
MHNKYIIFFCLINTVFAQVSLSDINRMSNEKLDEIRAEIESSNVNSQESTISSSSIEEVNISPPVSNRKSDSTLFGYSYFDKTINFFDNTPTPENFKLGPGDEIIVSLWGETNFQRNFIINKEGMIYYADIGFISLSNKTLKEAESILEDKLSSIYATLKDKQNSTRLMIELERLKSINVYFSGLIKNPGINVIHPFSDIFSAIIQAGGVEDNGSLRNIQLIRNGLVIDTIDFYGFFMEGKNNFSNTKIIDGDVIHIPDVTTRVFVDGEINRPGFYELVEGESVKTLVGYASGFTSEASSNIIIKNIIPIESRISDDNARSSQNINVKNFESVFLNNGDKLTVNTIGDVLSTVEVLGRVKNPGSFSAIDSSVKDILDIAGGFDDPIFRKSIRDDSIVIIRKDNKQFYGLEFTIPYSESANFKVKPEDKIFVYEDINYNNLFTVMVNGEVNKRGSFQLRKGMTVQDAINLAEGFSPLANKDGIIISEVFTSTNDNGEEIQGFNQVNDASLDFELRDGSIINILPMESVVSVEGNVYDPGLIVYSGGKSLKKYINLAGGHKPNTLTNKIYVKRANGRIKKVSLFRGIGISVNPGDTIFVPLDPDPQDFDITAFIADFASTLANIAAILVIAEKN